MSKSKYDRFKVDGRSEEKESAKLHKGKLSPNSGAGKTKGDYQIENTYLVEHKFTEKDSFRVSKGLLDKIKVEADTRLLRPLMFVRFQDGEGYFVVPEKEFLNIIQG